MRVLILFDRAAWEKPSARYAIEAVAPLLDLQWRAAAPGSVVEEGEAIVFVGAPASAPMDAAAIGAVGASEAWGGASSALARFEGVPLPCPGGRVVPAADPRELPDPRLRA